tara:strand:+ start:1411 stop:2409 length:999 start_codon:yes stop_codon:yes gene_type:complete
MDPLSQGVIGAVAAQQKTTKNHFVIATILGFLSGMAADLDIFIRSSNDPLLYLEFHRQFTHSLIFIPIGGFLCAIFFYYLFLRNKDITFKQTYIYSTLGYATHGLLDSCTTYGTQLLWPFTDDRVAWNTISIIDPLFTIPLLSLIILAVIKKKKIISYLALFWVIFYSIFGLIQKERAEAIGAELASSRGHELVNVVAKPSFANLIVWKIIYTTKDSYYIDAVRLGLEENIIEGVKIDKLNIQKSFPWLDLKSQQARDIERFRWFSNGYLALSETHPNRIIDIRYSMLPNEGHGLWGIELRPNANQSDHVVTVSNRRSDMETYKKLWKMISN